MNPDPKHWFYLYSHLSKLCKVYKIVDNFTYRGHPGALVGLLVGWWAGGLPLLFLDTIFLNVFDFTSLHRLRPKKHRLRQAPPNCL